MTRREALAVGAAVGLTALNSDTSAMVQANETTQAIETPWIDAHSHIWPPGTDKFPLAPGKTKMDLNPPSFTDDELMAIARPEGVGRVVLIQHSVYHLFDNSYLIDAVRRHPKMFRVQGMVDDQQPHPGETMKKLLPQGVTGFRITPFIRDPKDQAAWLTTPGMIEMWKTGAATRQAMCLLINAADLPSTDKMCEQHPDTPVVIDHFARIGADGQLRDAEIKNLCRLARHKQTSVKISAFYALGQKKPPHDELIPMIKRLLEAFGPQRLMWASDCPYQIQGANNYKASISLVRDRLDFVSAEDKQWLLAKTAEKFFFYA
jgi:predicted TIM-barrel fold metal-dependent hydrolase